MDYNRILRIDTQLAQAVLDRSAEYDVFVPPSLIKNEFIFFAADNTDFSEDTPDGKGTLHATAMVVYQRKTEAASNPIRLNVDESPRARSLSLRANRATELLPCHVPAKAKPTCSKYDAVTTNPNPDITCMSCKDDFVWSIGQSFSRAFAEKQYLATWGAYNSIKGSKPNKLTRVAMMPLLAARAHEWSTMLTILKQAQKITSIVMGEGRKTVITFDLQLYEKAVKLQMHSAPPLDHLVFRIGETHTVFTSLRALGSFIEESGFDDAWMEADFYGTATTHQIIEGRHMKRALTAHSITSSALCDMHLSAFLQSESLDPKTEYANLVEAASRMNSSCKEHQFEELSSHHQHMVDVIEADAFIEKLERFDKDMESCHPTFKFARDYMRFVTWIFLFIRATREGNWMLHLESLKALAKYFFAYDRLNYARMVPLYLAQIERLKTSDPDIYGEFLTGNFLCLQE